MASETQKPLSRDFQVDSGSISFGRFDNEILCWERRSTFSHNRYLEDVEKCSKPGLVTEKKAYFEAHFRKKGFLSPTSLICFNRTCYENTGNYTSSNDEKEIDCSNASPQFDQIMDDSDHQQASYETQLEYCTNDVSTNVEYIPMVDTVDDVEPPISLSKNSSKTEIVNLETGHGSHVAAGLSPQNYANQETSRGIPKDQQNSGRQENVLSKLDNINPRVVPRSRVGESKTYPTPKGAENNNNRKVRNVPARSITEKKIAEYPDKCLLNKTSKYKSDSKSKRADDMNRTGKESRNMNVVAPQSSRSQTVSSRVHQNTNSLSRSKVTAALTKPAVRPNITRSTSKCDEHARTINVVITSNSESKKLHVKSSVSGTRVSKNSPSADVGRRRGSLVPKTSGIKSRVSGCVMISKKINGVSGKKEGEKVKISGSRVGESNMVRSFDGKLIQH